jgi:hypothetical protein
MPMPIFTPEFVWQLICLAFAFGGVYFGIRADIKHIIEKVTESKASATRAHERIDQHISEYHRGK